MVLLRGCAGHRSEKYQPGGMQRAPSPDHPARKQPNGLARIRAGDLVANWTGRFSLRCGWFRRTRGNRLQPRFPHPFPHLVRE